MPPKRKAKSSPQNQAQRKKHNTQQEKKAEEPQPQVTPDQSRSSMADGKKASLDDAAAAKAPSIKDEDYTATPDAERSAENSLPNSEPTPSSDATPTRTSAPDASRSSSSGRLSESSRPTSGSKDSLGGSNTVSGNRDSIGGPYRHIVEAMNDWGDDTGQIVAVSQLCEQLSVATEETLTGFPTNAMVVSLVALMGAEYNPDLMLVATRTLTHLLEAKPSATTVVIRNQVVPVLCSKLLMIEYIDLAEQSLTALEKISLDHGIEVLRAGGLSACLNYIDFFAIPVQRVAVNICANVCRSVPHDCLEMVLQSAPALTLLMNSQDSKIVERACLCFSRLVATFRHSAPELTQLAQCGFLKRLMDTLTATPRLINTPTFTMVLKTFSTVLKGAPALTQIFIENDVTGVLRGLLRLPSDGEDVQKSLRSYAGLDAEQLYELFYITCEMLPPLPTDKVFTSIPVQHHGVPGQSKHPSGSTHSHAVASANAIRGMINRTFMQRRASGGNSATVDTDASASTTTPGKNNRKDSGPDQNPPVDPRVKLLSDHPTFLPELAAIFIPVVMAMPDYSFGARARTESARVLNKVLYFSTASELKESLKDIAVSSYLAAQLARKSESEVQQGLQMTSTLMKKMPDVFGFYFQREGVVHEICRVYEAYERTGTDSSATDKGDAKEDGHADDKKDKKKDKDKDKDKEKGKDKDNFKDKDKVKYKDKDVHKDNDTDKGKETERSATEKIKGKKEKETARDDSSGDGKGKEKKKDSKDKEGYGNRMKNMLAKRFSNKSEDPKTQAVGVHHLSDMALLVLTDHFPSTLHHSGAEATSGVLTQLIPLLADLTAGKNIKHSLKVVAELLNSSPTGITAFELIHGNVVPQLVIYLLNGHSAHKWDSHVARRLRDAREKELMEAFTNTDGTSERSGEALTVLMKHLHSMLAKEDIFGTALHELADSSYGSAHTLYQRYGVTMSSSAHGTSHSLHSLVRGLRLKLTREYTDADRHEDPVYIREKAAAKKKDKSKDKAAGNPYDALVGYSPVIQIDPLSTVIKLEQYTMRNIQRSRAHAHAMTSMKDSATSRTATADARATSASSAKETCDVIDGNESQRNSTQPPAAESAQKDPAEETPTPADTRKNTQTPEDRHKGTDKDTDKDSNKGTRAHDNIEGDHMDGDSDHDKSHAMASSDDDGGSDNDNEAETLVRMYEQRYRYHSGYHGGMDDENSDSYTDVSEDDDDMDDDVHADNHDMSDADEEHDSEEDHSDDDRDAEADEIPGARSLIFNLANESDDDDGEALMPTADTDSPVPSKEKDSSATARKSLSKKPSTKLPQNTNSAPKSERSPNSAQTGQGASSIPANGTASAGTADVMVIDFYLDGNYIPRDLPIFYAIQRFAPSFERDFTHSHAKADAVVGKTTGDCESNRHIPGSYLWNRSYELTYRVRMATADEAPPALSLSLSDSNAHRNGQKLDATSVLAPPPTSAVKLQYVNEFADPRELCKGLKMYRDRGENVSVEESAIREVLVYAIFHLMAVVWRHTQGTGGSVFLSPGEFVNPKISAKVTQQLADPLSLASRCLPQWVGALMHKFGFLFSYECRRQYMMAMYIGIPRSTQKMMSASGRTGSALHRLTADRFTHTARIKARVRRQHLLQSVFKMLTKLGGYRSIIDIEFVDEVGTGLGPTLEFYCLASKEFQRRDLKIWRDADASAASEETKECVKSMCGLFPRPEPVVSANGKSPKDLPTSTDYAKSQQPTDTDATAERRQYSTSLFHAMGMLLARALYDNRLIDIPLNPVVYAWLKLPSVDSTSDNSESNDNAKVTAADARVSTDSVSSISTLANLALVDAQLTQSMQKMQTAALNKKSTGGRVVFDGATVDDLCLDFTLPGHPSIELVPDGKNVAVTSDNVTDYVEAVVRYTLVDGVREQMMAMRRGFASVLPLPTVSLFSAEELSHLLCGATETWTLDMLHRVVKPDHGYTHSSRPVEWLFNVISKYNSEEQRKFLQFVTGAPQLPVGGLAALTPPLTVVRVRSDVDTCDSLLPSVMTCQNYFKLPDYTSEEILAHKLQTAIVEGTGSFHLS